MKVTLNHFKELVITSGFGDVDKVYKTPHTGIDIAFNLNDPILSPINGVISRVGDCGNTSLGKFVVVKFESGKELIFGHLNQISVYKGELVSIGMELGKAGSTGNSTGNHLHLALKDVSTGQFLDPIAFEKILQKVYVLHDSGYLVLQKIQHIAEIASQLF